MGKRKSKSDKKDSEYIKRVEPWKHYGKAALAPYVDKEPYASIASGR